MNIYLLSQDKNDDYDTYDSCVVCAESEDDARTIHPSSFATHHKDNKFMGTYTDGSGEYVFETDEHYESWVKFKDRKLIKVTKLGRAKPQMKKGVICSSFNAG